MDINKIDIGTQIVFSTPLYDNIELHATCIFIDDEYYEFVAEVGSFNIRKDNYDEIIDSFKVCIIDNSHSKWEEIDGNSFKFFDKLNDLEKKFRNGEINDEEIQFLQLLEELGDEYDDENFKDE